jgi:ectoine hydroxylase-related dioxygenase (phytanoyl-CoA dioxygenase family)
MLTKAQKYDLADHGYIVLEGYMSPALLEEVRNRVDELFEQEGDSAGSEFKQEPGARRLANLVDKGEVFARCISMPEILEGTKTILGPAMKLSSLNVRSANPMSDDAQPLHCDMGAIPDGRGYWVANTVWMLDEFTKDNGAIRVVPGTHNSLKLPQDVLTDLRAPHPNEILVTAPAGTVVIMNAHCWHGGTANRTDKPRRAMHSFYCRSDKPQQQWQKKLLRPETQARLSPELRKLLALDDPENDRLSSADVVRSGFLK